MNVRSFLKEFVLVFLNNIYVIIEALGFFISSISFTTYNEGRNTFDLLFFIFYNILLTFKIIFYVQIISSNRQNKNTKFSYVEDPSIVSDFSNVNPYLADEISKEIRKRGMACRVCNIYRPPRSQHCNRCNRCYLRMSHHSVFFNTCITFNNYKFYYQFLILNFLGCILFFGYIDNLPMKSDEYQGYYEYIVTCALFGIMTVYTIREIWIHTHLILRNETYIESKALDAYINNDYTYRLIFQEGVITRFSFSRDRKILNPYNLGKMQNWKEIFGDNIWYWFFPVFTTKGNGFSFPKNTDNLKRYYPSENIDVDEYLENVI